MRRGLEHHKQGEEAGDEAEQDRKAGLMRLDCI